MREIPTPNEGPKEADEQYRRLSDRDQSSPSEAVRRAVLRHAAALAAQAPTQRNSTAVDGQNARRPRWRAAAYGGLAAAAALTGLLLAPHFLMPARPPPALQPEVSAPPQREADAQPLPGPARDSLASPRALSPSRSASRGASIASPSAIADPSAALRDAARRGDVSALRRLLADPPNIDARDASGRTALMLAVLQGQKEAVNTLLAAGADPNAADTSGTTPLQVALANSRSAIAAALEQSGAR